MGRSVTLVIGSLFTAFIILIALIAGPSAATSRMSLAERQHKTHHRLYWTVENTNVTKNNETVVVPTVNGMFPGPTIHVNEGDTLVIKVTNKVDSDVTIHWHGIKQIRTNWADGPSHITQCPLREGQSMTYEFTVSDQHGTYFWHAHAHWLRATMYGAFIIHPRASPPYATPAAEIPITFGEWYPETPNSIESTGIASHGPTFDPQYTASTLNGLAGPLYNGSRGHEMQVKVVSGKTYLLRLINAALNSDFYFVIANHNMTVVAADGEYVKEFTTSEVLLSPGQTTDVLVTANQPTGKYYFGIGEWSSSPVPNYIPPPPALGMLQYTGSSSSAKLAFPTFPKVNATTDQANEFRDKLFGLANYSLPQKMDRELVFAATVANVVCKQEENCTMKTGGTINNFTFDNPVNSSILESYYYNIKGVYGTDFPTLPPAIVNFTSSEPVAAYTLTGNRGAKVVTLKYNETVQLVLQDLDGLLLEDHPFHLHGHNFYVVGRGSGNFNGSRDPDSFNLVDPPMRNTVVLPQAGWVAIRFIANNPGVWYFHCHIERHTSWGMMMAFITENGKGAAATLPGPKHSMPKCTTVSIKH